MKRKSRYKTICGLVSCVLVSLTMVYEAKADGTEVLGPPSINIASGTDIMVEGIGLYALQPGNITIETPAGASVAQVLLYWSGRQTSDPGLSDIIQVNGVDVTGDRIGGPTDSPFPSSTYRADITGNDWILDDAVNNLTVGGLNFGYQNDGAAVVVILNDGSGGEIQIADGNDFGYLGYDFGFYNLPTKPVDFPFAPSDAMRVGTIWLVVTDISIPRPAAVDVTIDGLTTRIDDVFLENEGDLLDIVELEVEVPAGVDKVTVQILSIDDGSVDEDGNPIYPASLSWLCSAWVLKPLEPPCGGGGLTPGFWQNKHGLGYIEEYGALEDLNILCLRNDDGSHADFYNLKEFRAWIKGRNAKNMAYQLSGHLAAMYMNVLVGYVNEGALVYIGDEGDMISINNLMIAANEALKDGENRDKQEMLKDALDKANNNLNWVNPCTNSF